MKTIGAGLYFFLTLVAVIAALVAFVYSFVANVDTSGSPSGKGLVFTVLFGGAALVCFRRARQVSKEKKMKEN
jgi:hypothetical protein